MKSSQKNWKTRIRVFTVTLLTGMLVGIGGFAAYAVSASTVQKTLVTVSGTCYQGKATVTKITHVNPAAYMSTYAKASGCATAKTVPSGYIAAVVILERNNVGCAISSASNQVNPSADSTHLSVAIKDCGVGQYRALGTGGGYNTSTGHYVYADLPPTPIISVN